MINNVELRDRVTTALIQEGVVVPNRQELSNALRSVGAGDTIWVENVMFVQCQFCGHRELKEKIALTTNHEFKELLIISKCVKARRERQKGNECLTMIK